MKTLGQIAYEDFKAKRDDSADWDELSPCSRLAWEKFANANSKPVPEGFRRLPAPVTLSRFSLFQDFEGRYWWVRRVWSDEDPKRFDSYLEAVEWADTQEEKECSEELKALQSGSA